jgi:hypothetical protein
MSSDPFNTDYTQKKLICVSLFMPTKSTKNGTATKEKRFILSLEKQREIFPVSIGCSRIFKLKVQAIHQ